MRVYLAHRDGPVLETTAPLKAVLELLDNGPWMPIQVRTAPRQRYQMTILNANDIECAWERGNALPTPWRSPFAGSKEL